MSCETSCSTELADELAEAGISDSQLMKSPLVQSLISTLSIPLIKSPFELQVPLEIKAETERIIAGYASVDVIDKQGDMIPLEVLKDAWNRFKSNPDFMMSQILHSNIPIGKILLEHPKCPKKSGVDENGLFIIVKLRDDIKKADETWYLIKQGKLKAFSIGGEALHKSVVCEGRCYTRIDKLELHEITICASPANQASFFSVLKSLDKIIKLDDVLKTLPEGMILIKDFINFVGSVPETGKSSHDFDLQVKHPLDQNSFLRRAVTVRLQKQFPNLKVERGGDVDVIFGDTQGPHDTFIPLYDLVLMKRHPLEKIDMTLKAEGKPKGNKQRFMSHFGIKENQHNLIHGILGDKMYTLLPERGQKVKSELEKPCLERYPKDKKKVEEEILKTLQTCEIGISLVKASMILRKYSEVNKVWSESAREAALEARRAKTTMPKASKRFDEMRSFHEKKTKWGMKPTKIKTRPEQDIMYARFENKEKELSLDYYFNKKGVAGELSSDKSKEVFGSKAKRPKDAGPRITGH